jgi:Ni/Co efflux regulator RcnB
MKVLLAAATLALGLAPMLAEASHDRRGHDRDHRYDRYRDAPAVQHRSRSSTQVHLHMHRGGPVYHAPQTRIVYSYSQPHSRYYAPPRVVYSQPPRWHSTHYVPPRGYQARHWRSGQYLPPSYRGSHYVMSHHHYRLPPPPRGYHYVRVDDNALLVAVASGLIADVMFNAFYR